ncbi:SH3 domain protein [Dictyocaulus viviparus]|uniref:Osteoclast-stimulating factor 1 n=1 Tax=Dictyocaulus viviparus TaxID=29172 RepID=A0A0D8Y3C5_DICVI|nr:SH3 domain protein [Dictyocaulus viviparus]
MTPVPPRPAPKPGRVRVYRALYDYEARTNDEMSFSEGDLLYVSDRGPNNDWLSATCGGRKGLVPANYVVSENVAELSNPLHEAARRGNVLFLKDCISNQNKLGDTPLHAASWRGHKDCVQLLVDNGANLWIRNRDQKLPIDVSKDVEIANMLDKAMKRDTRNEECENEYESGSDNEL